MERTFDPFHFNCSFAIKYIVKSFEQYKYKANNLRIFGIALMSPFASIVHMAVTQTNIYDILNLRGFSAFILMFIGLILIGQGNEILEKCDELYIRNN